MVARNSTKKSDVDDGIAEDVRKIKESMKDLAQQEQQPSSSTAASKKKTRTPAAKSSTPKVRSQATKREKKSNSAKDVKESSPVSVTRKSLVEDKSKLDRHELKNELLADWLDDDEIGVAKNDEGSVFHLFDSTMS